MLSLASREIAGHRYFLASALVLDQSWVSLQPRLSPLVAARIISWGDQGSGTVLWREGLLPDGRNALTLAVDGWLYRMIPDLTGLALAPMPESFWVLFGALGLIMALAILQVAARDRERRSHGDWRPE